MIPAKPDQAGVLAAIHAEAFDHPWDAAALADLLKAQGVFALIDPRQRGFILIRVAADEAEVLTLAVAPSARRQGLGRRLVEDGAEKAAALGAESLFLEVAADNGAAIALYAALSFKSAGRRARYYARSGAVPVDALVLMKRLARPA
jgi:ribosomal-protein-alanine N-acetyltransferase